MVFWCNDLTFNLPTIFGIISSNSATNSFIDDIYRLKFTSLSVCLCSSSKSIVLMLTNDISIKMLGCNCTAMTLQTVGGAPCCIITSLESLNSAIAIAIKCVRGHLWPQATELFTLHQSWARHYNPSKIGRETRTVFKDIFNLLTLPELCFFSLGFHRCTGHVVQCIVINKISKNIKP